MRKSWLAFVVVFSLMVITWNADKASVTAQDIYPESDTAATISPRNRSYPVLRRGFGAAQNVWTGDRTTAAEALPITPAASLELPSAEYFQNMAFQSFRDSTWEIYQAFNVDHYDPAVARLTNDAWYDGEPNYNRGCSLITFTSERDGNAEIYILNVTTGGIQRLTWNAAADYSPVWSYDDSNIVFVSERDGNPEIYIMGRDGSNVHRVSNDPTTDFSPTFSPDGSQIAWLKILDSQSGIIVVANRDGSNLHTVGVPLRFVYDLSWSRNGGYFAFDYDGNLNGWNELAMMNADGSNLLTLWNPGVEKEAWAGSWSVANIYIFFSNIDYILYDGNYYIYQVDTYRKTAFSAGMDSIILNQYDFDPRACPSDITIPQSRVANLPMYSRAAGFQVSWHAYDPGPAYLFWTRVQYRSGATGEWTTFAGSAEDTDSSTFMTSPGQTVYFRSQASDEAEHYEPWPAGDGDTSTNLFSWLLHGKVSDPRGQPLPGASIALSPAAWNTLGTALDGYYLGYLATSGEHQFTCQLTGYAELPASSLDIQGDEQFNTYVLPKTDWMDNGGFEDNNDPFKDWQLSNDPVSPMLDMGHSGTYSARLGMPCESPCFTEALEFPYITQPEQEATILADQLGNVHILFEYRKYLMRDAQGVWHGPEIIGDLPDPGNLSVRPALAVDSQGGVHAIVIGAVVSIEYYYKPAGGSWELQHDLAGGTSVGNPTISVNDQGTVFITFVNPWTTYYLVRQSSGTWGSIQVLTNARANDMALVTDAAGYFHFVYSIGGAHTFYRRFLPDGSSTFGNEAYAYETSDIRLAAGPDGRLHLIVQENVYGGPWYYLTLLPGDNWSIPFAIEARLTDASLVVDSNGTVHVLAVDTFDSTYPTYYYRKTADETYFQRIFAFPGSYMGALSLAIDPEDRLYTAWGDWFTLKFRETMLWSAESPIWLATHLSVPVNAHQPTFSFMYRLESNPDIQPIFDVSVTDEHNTPVITPAYILSQAPNWTLGWIDLQPWAGQDVTITFSLSQPAGTLPSSAWIDSVSAGEWLTPVVTAVSPTHLDAWEGGWLTITGSNFPQSPSVRLGSIMLGDAVVIDDETLQAYVPPGTPVGFYAIYVLTSTEQVGVAPQAVEIGCHIWLPLVGR
jgi:hypothetical protein